MSVNEHRTFTDAEEKTNELKEVLSNHIAGIFRWIPSDITVSYDGKVKFNSYIPGLHPFNNSELYPNSKKNYKS